MTKLVFALILSAIACLGGCAPVRSIQLTTDDPAVYDALVDVTSDLSAHLPIELGALGPRTTGVGWRSAEHWRVVVDDAGDHPVLCGTSALAQTVYAERAIYVGVCALGYDLATILRHEVGHAVGQPRHRGEQDRDVMAASVTNHVVPYSESDYDWIASAVDAPGDTAWDIAF